MTPFPDDLYCACNPKQIYLDIVFVVDTSGDMTSKTVGDVSFINFTDYCINILFIQATATIQSTLYALTFGTGFYQSNVAVLAYGDTVQVRVGY